MEPGWCTTGAKIRSWIWSTLNRSRLLAASRSMSPLVQARWTIQSVQLETTIFFFQCNGPRYGNCVVNYVLNSLSGPSFFYIHLFHSTSIHFSYSSSSIITWYVPFILCFTLLPSHCITMAVRPDRQHTQICFLLLSFERSFWMCCQSSFLKTLGIWLSKSWRTRQAIQGAVYLEASKKRANWNIQPAHT